MTDNPYLDWSAGKLYARFLPSAIVSLLISSVASLIDTIVVSYFMGPQALSAVNVCMPIYSILTAIAMLVIGGAGTLYGQFLGQNDKNSANRVFTLAVLVLFVFGLLYSIAGIIWTGPIVRFLGANDNIYQMAYDYGRILFFFALVNIFFPLLQTFIRIDLNPGLTVAAIVLTAVINLIFDILFVGPFLSPTGFGTEGAAYATCLAYVVAFLLMMTHFLRKKNTLRLVPKFWQKGELGKMILTGVPASITLFGTAITLTVFNNFIIRSGEAYAPGVGELYVSVYSIIVQVLTISMALYVGIAQCAQPIMAANFGAGRKDRLKDLFKRGIILEIIGNILLMIVFYFAAGSISKLFSMDKGAVDMTEVAIRAIRIFSTSLVFTGINQMILYLFQTTGDVTRSSIISALSGTFLLIGGLYLLAGVLLKGNIYGDGIWFSYLFAQGLTMIYSLISYFKTRKNIFG